MRSTRKRSLTSLILFGVLAVCRPSGAAPRTASANGYLSVSANGKYIIDEEGQPFFIVGDAAWSLIAELDKSGAVTYLSDRASRGFNTIIVNLLEHHFATYAPANIDGDFPFAGTAFQSSPNERYFAHADYVIEQARMHGITVLLFPAYAGHVCNSEGWCAEMQAATDSQMYAWGQYVGSRYTQYPNIIWVIGGDVDPSAYPNLRSRLNQVALGIRASDSRHSLVTAHNDRGQSAMDVWTGSPWLTLNAVYGTSTSMAAQCASNYSRSEALPLFAFEDYYENEHSMTDLDLRKEGYWAVLSGCTCGRIFGNNPIWGFSWFSTNWQNALGSTGSVQAALIGRLMRSREFWLMAPDLDHTVMTAGYGSESTLAVTSRTSNGHTIVSYIPEQRAVEIDLTRVSGSSAKSWWFNPQTGSSTLIGIFPNAGVQQFMPPDQNDWVLVIDDASLELPAPGSQTIGVLGDFDKDRDVDQDDRAIFEMCSTGPGILYGPGSMPPGCPLALDQGFLEADFDQDQDIDQSDFSVFQRSLDAGITNVPGDFDEDGDVDQSDWTTFEMCSTGPGIPYGPGTVPPGCPLALNQGFMAADFDQDQDVDQSDFGVFQRCLSGINVLADPSWGN